jgi:UDP-GlcNAc:undecaprenyl-phosphate/decaprenyl-phosphate GlcNAc-1-phosphate transferase
MLQYLPSFGLILLIGLLLSAAIAPLMSRLGLRLGVADRPGGRRRHGRLVSRLGGVALYAGFTAAVCATLVLPPAWFPPRLDPKELYRLTGLLIGMAVVFLFGLVDDRWEIAPLPQYVVQLLSSLIAVAFIIFIERVNDPFANQALVFAWPVVWVVTIFWFMGMMNTVNWLDGLDGLATGVAAIMCAVLAIHMLREGQYSVALLPLALLGATLGFLPFNFNPARVFMGSNGSYFLGWALAALGIIAGAKVATVLLVMGLPILDVAWLIIYRWRHGARASLAGRDHLHFRLADMGFSQRQIVIGYYVFSAGFGVLALGLGSRLFKLVALILLSGAALAVIIWATWASDRRTRRASSVAVEPECLTDDVQRPALHLVVDPAQVLADDSQADQLHPSEEQHAYQGRGLAIESLAARQPEQDCHDDAQDAQAGGDEAKVGRDLQR